jgi:nucleotide sugar dehydrogenase
MLLPDSETTEFAKLAESVYRDVNIALANELARAAEAAGIDYATAAKAANSQPYSHLHTPGLGVGGHCIPVYPYFLLETTDQPLVSLGRRINDSMAAHAVDRLEAALDDRLGGRNILVLGLSYRGGVKEATLSSALFLADALTSRGAHVFVNDPLFSPEEIANYGLDPVDLPTERHIDAVVLQAMHPQYQSLDLSRLHGCKVFLDGRNAFSRERVEAAGLTYLAIGLGTKVGV